MEAGALRLEWEKEYLYWLCQVPVLGAVKIKRLWQRYGSFERIYNIEGIQLTEEQLLTTKEAACFDAWKSYFHRTVTEYRGLSQMGIRFVTILDQDYPQRLKHLYDNPMGLYVKGRMPDEQIPSVAIVGARNCSTYGIQISHMLGECLGRAGVQVVSGMALGIDGAGHQGTLDAGGSTFAVLGSGVDVCYPRRHLPIYDKIPEKGGVISEFKLHEQPLAQHFPMRNRIISGLADAVIVVEARERSGSLITVEQGLEQGREIFVVPGRMTDPLSLGCNQLIRQGANIVTCPQDILEYFQIKSKENVSLCEKNQFGLAKNEKMVYSCLDFQPKFFDQVVEESGLPLEEVMQVLLELEWKGLILQPASHYYVKKL